MAVESFAQLEQLWVDAGGDPALAPTMAAIALAESGGDPTKVNPTDNNGTQSSFGLWQISNGTHTPPSIAWADPAINASLAVAKYNGPRGLLNWGTYTSRAYLAFLPGGDLPQPITDTGHRPSGKAIMVPAVVNDSPGVTRAQAVAAIEAGSAPPDVLRSWKGYTDAIGTHAPRQITRAMRATRAIRALR